jgi:hypothetical protein
VKKFRNIMLQPFLVDQDTISDYSLTNEFYLNYRFGDLRKATQNNGTIPYLIKILHKSSPLSSRAFYIELSCYTLISHRSLVPAVSFFENDRCYYVVYAFPDGDPIPEYLPDTPRTHGLAVQFLDFLEFLHQRGIFYLRPSVDNIWVTENGHLLVVGLDFASTVANSLTVSISPFVEWDPAVTVGTDWFALANFCAHLISGRSIALDRNPRESPRVGAHEDLILSLWNPDQSERDAFDPRQHVFFEHESVVEFGDTFFSIDDLRLDVSAGLTVTKGKMLVGYQRGGLGLLIGDQGRVFRVDTDDRIVLDQGSRYICIDRDHVELRDWRGRFQLASGNCVFETSPGGQLFALTPEWLTYAESETQRLIINSETVESTFPRRNCQVNVVTEFPAVKVRIGPVVINLRQSHLAVKFAGCRLYLDPGGLIFRSGDTILSVGDDGLTVRLGWSIFSFRPESIELRNGQSTAQITPDKISLVADGFNCKVTGTLVSLTRKSVPVEILGIAVAPMHSPLQLPHIEQFAVPTLIPVPQAEQPRPSILRRWMGHIGSQVNVPQQAEDLLPEGETVKHSVLVTIKRALMFKVKRHVVVTSSQRVLLISEHCSSIKGELNMTGERPTITPKAETALEVVDRDDRSEIFEFADTQSRDRWARILTRLLRVEEMSP